ncbi:MAG: hypothetical protein CL920_32290 [Deltaproteobacteria bacterium]|nr:hypothetical protein [Deltaproteobacteria bacterium]MBU53399.1 hypothetical protein [Deltaproteobacteria bacterium]
MPIYEFYCPECSRQFELLVSRKEADQTECPECGHHQMERMMSIFSSRSSASSEEAAPASSHTPSTPAASKEGAIFDHCSQSWKHVG